MGMFKNTHILGIVTLRIELVLGGLKICMVPHLKPPRILSKRYILGILLLDAQETLLIMLNIFTKVESFAGT